MNRSLLVSNIEAAKRDVTDAEADMEKLIQELRVMARAEKTTISQALETAFSKLRGARRHLEVLEDLLADDRDPT